MKAYMGEINIPAGNVSVGGELVIPDEARGIVVFSHGSGSSRFSPQNKAVARELNDKQIGTLLFDLLTQEEDEEYSNRFNIELLAKRLISVTQWLMAQYNNEKFNIGYYGASTGTASALRAAARLPLVKAVVSRGGRPDLAGPELNAVKAPTLLMVGGQDYGVIELNEEAFDKLNCTKELRIIEGATHLFEEPEKLEEVSEIAATWFEKHLA